jgi:hypothetical protein
VTIGGNLFVGGFWSENSSVINFGDTLGDNMLLAIGGRARLPQLLYVLRRCSERLLGCRGDAAGGLGSDRRLPEIMALRGGWGQS